MEKLESILENKKTTDSVKKAITLLYEPAVEFWGKDKEALILKTIQDFQIVSINHLGEKVEKACCDTKSPQSPNTTGICMILPVVESQQIIGVKRVILLDEAESHSEIGIINLLAHELFFHGVKSIIQPNISLNQLMMGLDQTQYIIDLNNQIVGMYPSGDNGIEELSTYYGQYWLMEKVNVEFNNVPLLFLEVMDSLGNILKNTSFGQLILDAQITKDSSKLESVFLEVAKRRKFFHDDMKELNWKGYNQLATQFIGLHQKFIDSNIQTEMIDDLYSEYQKSAQKIIEINTQLLFAALLFDSDLAKKKKLDY